ncbi:spore coat protein [Paenibacillus chondroitinus]|uniref:Spore coat protein n=1 Tax=Paenibacillus chondroitinus TaxID=59842 RepID=A0ABU6DNL9_9BACL|nr:MULTISPECIES: spore coat protein [Paenibacillus]MCY9660559.1 spore coat protein [Paenibacillus anseongense]MEB4798920.1 spore coat protein [Paenibacillus chondroitinus]
MYQQNAYQQQQQQQQHQVLLQEQDLANLVLSELKRSAGEYTTAVTEAVNPQIKQTFQTLLTKTLQCHATLFQEIQKLGYYEVQPAEQQRIQQELQKQGQTAAQLQSFVHQNLSQASTTMSYQQQESMGISQQQPQQQQQQYSQIQHQQAQSQQHNPIAGLHQHQAPIQPIINTSQYPNAVHNNQGQGYGQTSYGYSQSYGASENAGMTGKSANSSIASRQTSNVTGENSYMNKQHEGSKYSF